MTTRQPPVEVISTKAIYLEEGHVLPLPGTQCIYTGVERRRCVLGTTIQPRIRLQPDKSLKLGLFPQSIAQLKHNTSFPPTIPEPLPGQVILPGFDPGARSILTTIQQEDERQREITETARQNRQLWLLRSFGKHMDGVAGEYVEEENEMTEWWILEEALYEANEADDPDEAKIRYKDQIHEEIPLKPDTSYCITSPLHNKTEYVMTLFPVMANQTMKMVKTRLPGKRVRTVKTTPPPMKKVTATQRKQSVLLPILAVSLPM